MSIIDGLASSLGFVNKKEVDNRINGLKGAFTKEINKVREETKAEISISQVTAPPSSLAQILDLPERPAIKETEYLQAYRDLVSACVNLRANEMANLHLKLMKKKGEDAEEVVSHPVLDLIYGVNPFMSFYELFWLTSSHRDLAGESFWYLTKGKDQLWPLRPDWMDVKTSKTKWIDHYEYKTPGGRDPKRYEVEEIIHLKLPNPTNFFRGRGLVQAAALEIDTERQSAEWNANFFSNSALPKGILTTSTNLTEDQRKQVKAAWDAGYRGHTKAHKVALLSGDLKWQDVGLGQKDMDFVAQRKLSRDNILAIFGIPKPMLFTEDVNRAAAREARIVFAENTIDPMLRLFISQLNEIFLPRFGLDNSEYFFDYESPIPDDVEARYKQYERGIADGWMAPNEARTEEGLEPYEGGWDIKRPFNLQSAGSVNPPKKSLSTPQVAHYHPRVTLRPKPYKKHVAEEIVKGMKPQIVELVKVMLSKSGDKGIKQLQSKDRAKIVSKAIEQNKDKFWKIFSDRISQYEDLFINRMQQFFEEQEARMVDQVKHKRIAKNVEVNFDIDRENKLLLEIVTPIIEQIIADEGQNALEELGIDSIVFQSRLPAIVEYLREYSATLVTNINETTRDSIRKQLAEGTSEGESVNELRDRIQNVFSQAKSNRAEMIARTETVNASNKASIEAYKQSGVVDKLEWVAERDDRVDPICEKLDGKQVKIGHDFQTDIGPLEKPPVHPNCRCAVAPVISD